MFGPQQAFRQETSKPEKVGRTLSRLSSYFKPYWLVLLIVVAAIFGSAWTQVTSPKLMGQAVDCYLTPATVALYAKNAAAGLNIPGFQSSFSGATGGSSGSTTSTTPTNCWYTNGKVNTTTDDFVKGLASLILLIVALYVGGALIGGLQFYLMTWAGQRVLKNLRVKVFDHLHSLSLNYYSEHEAGNVMSRITNDMDTLQQVFNFALVNVSSGVILIIWLGYSMLHDSLAYGLISMAVVPVMFVATNMISDRARKAYRSTRQKIGAVNADLQESIAGVREVQAFGREDANIESFREVNAANRDANIQAVAITALLQPTLQGLGYLATAIVAITGGIILLRGTPFFGTAMSLGLVITFLSYVQRFNQPIQQISALWTNIQSAIAGAERIFGILDTVPDVTNAPNAQTLPPIQGKVEFDHVFAAYKPGELVLNDVSFTAEPGQTIAIVGATGAGKTTIMNLLPRFYDVVKGQIRVDGMDISKVTMESLRSQIGIVLQDTFLFSDSVMNNIRFGRPSATDDEVRAAAQLARAGEFIERLPEGYNTILGEHGAGLSQGQRQLISIARAALAKPRILILDEATSSVDSRTERLIQSALIELLKGRTSFVIAHRLSTIRNADLVMVIDGGKIVERGKHEELLAKQGAYYQLYMRQFVKNESNSPDPDGHSSVPVPGLSAT